MEYEIQIQRNKKQPFFTRNPQMTIVICFAKTPKKTHTSAGVDVLRAGRLPDEVVLVEAGTILGHHHRLCCTFGPGVNHLGHRVGV